MVLKLILGSFILLSMEITEVFATIDKDPFDQGKNTITPSKDVEDDVDGEETTKDSKNNETGMTPILVKATEPLKEEENETLEKHIFVDLVDSPTLHNDGIAKRDPKFAVDIPPINLPPEKKSWWSQFVLWLEEFFIPKPKPEDRKEKQ